MATSWNVIYEKFFNKIEKDSVFFTYNNVSTEEAITIATTRAKNYLIESVTKLVLNCSPDIDFHDYDLELEQFNIDLSQLEIDLIANLMREAYFEKDFSLLKAFQTKFTSKDLNMFSPANERKTFTEMFEGIVATNIKTMKQYASRDRVTGKLKTIDYSKYSKN